MCCLSPTMPARATGDRSQLSSSSVMASRKLRVDAHASVMPSMSKKCGLTCSTFLDLRAGLWWSSAMTTPPSFSSRSTWPEPMSRNIVISFPSFDSRSTRSSSNPLAIVRWNCLPARASAPAITAPAAMPSAS